MDDIHKQKHERDVHVPYPQHAKCKAELEAWRIDVERRMWTGGAGKALAPGTDSMHTASLDEKAEKACNIAYGIVLKSLATEQDQQWLAGAVARALDE